MGSLPADREDPSRGSYDQLALDERGRSEDRLLHGIGGEQLEFRASLDHENVAVLCGDVQRRYSLSAVLLDHLDAGAAVLGNLMDVSAFHQP